MTGSNPREWEYAALRAEILQNQRNALALITGSVAATAAILSAAISFDNGYVSLMVLVVVTPATYLWLSQVDSSYRLGAYIRRFLEPYEEKLQYEAKWAHCSKKGQRRLYNLSGFAFFHALGLLSIVVSFAQWQGCPLVPSLASTGFVAHVAWSISVFSRAKDSQRHAEFWGQ